jgi:hypothetical protein
MTSARWDPTEEKLEQREGSRLPKRFQRGPKIGSGSFGSVFECMQSDLEPLSCPLLSVTGRDTVSGRDLALKMVGGLLLSPIDL